jgi:hypothetical protein
MLNQGLPQGFQRDWARIANQKKFYNESDLVYHLAEICTQNFSPDWVHINTPISRMFFANKPRGRTGRYYIDIDIINPQKYANGAQLRQTTHDIFVEVKWISLEIWSLGMQNKEIQRKIEGIRRDHNKLKNQVASGRCDLGFVCVVDDMPKKTKLQTHIATWPPHPQVQILTC